MHLQSSLKRALTSALLISTHIGIAKGMTQAQPQFADLSAVAATSLVPVKDGAIAGDPFRAEDLWKNVPADECVIIHIVRRPG
mgnify:CR=1 FL=1